MLAYGAKLYIRKRQRGKINQAQKKQRTAKKSMSQLCIYADRS